MALAWDDLQLVLAVARGRNLAASARRLEVDPSTVYRRLGALESRLGASLFERLASGYVPTALGSELVATAERMDQAAAHLEESLADGSAPHLTGTLRLTAPDDIAALLIMPILAAFRAEHGEVEVELVIDNRNLNLTRREADVAVRPTSAPPPHLFGRRAATLSAAVWGPAPLAGQPLEALPWIAWEEGSGPPSYQDWLQREVPGARRVLRSSTLLGQAQAAAAGIGVALMPDFLGASLAGLRRLTPGLPALQSDLWLLTPSELRRRPVVRHFLDFAFAKLKAQRRRLALPEVTPD